MGRVPARRSLKEVLRDYDVTRGWVWVLLLRWTTLAPVVFHLRDRNWRGPPIRADLCLRPKRRVTNHCTGHFRDQ